MRSKFLLSFTIAGLHLLTAATCWGQVSTINLDVPGPADWNVANNWIVPGFGNVVPGDSFPDEIVGISNGGTATLSSPAAFPVAGLVIGESGQFPDGGPELGTLEVSGASTTLTVALTGVADTGNVRLGDDGAGFLNVSGGVLDFQNDFLVGNGGRGVLTMTGGTITAGDDMRVRGGLGTDASALSMSGMATIDVNDELDLDTLATIRGPDVGVFVGGRLRVLGTLNPVITSPTDHSAIIAAGAAQLGGGTVRPEFDGVTPGVGDSWTLINADSVTGNLTVDASAAPALPRGLFYVVELNEGASTNVDLVVTNRLILSVDRISGATAIENVIGDPIDMDGYSIGSAAGNLNPAGWTSLEGAGTPDWREIGSPSANLLAELNPTGSSTLNAGAQFSMGNVFQSTSFGQPEDIVFEYTAPDSGDVISGMVEYLGPHNNLVLTVDPLTGEAVLENQSVFEAAVDGYIISSPSGSLLSADGQWNSLQDQVVGAWEEARPTEFNLSELNPTGATTFGSGTSFNLGTLFDTGGTQDIGLEFHLAGVGILTGVVEYGELPSMGLNGDTNGDGTVNIDDLNNVRNNFGAVGPPDGSLDGDAFPFDGMVDIDDLNAVRNNFGAISPAPVPEPSAILLLTLGCIALIAARRSLERRKLQGERATLAQ